MGYWMVPLLPSQDWCTLCPPGLLAWPQPFNVMTGLLQFGAAPWAVSADHTITSDTCHFLSSKRIAAMTSNQTGSLRENHLEQFHFKENGFKAALLLGVLVRKLMPLQHSSLWQLDTILLEKKEKQEKPLYPQPLPRWLFSGVSSLHL